MAHVKLTENNIYSHVHNHNGEEHNETVHSALKLYSAVAAQLFEEWAYDMYECYVLSLL